MVDKDKLILFLRKGHHCPAYVQNDNAIQEWIDCCEEAEDRTNHATSCGFSGSHSWYEIYRENPDKFPAIRDSFHSCLF